MTYLIGTVADCPSCKFDGKIIHILANKRDQFCSCPRCGNMYACLVPEDTDDRKAKWDAERYEG